jgi:hypothetical protein
MTRKFFLICHLKNGKEVTIPHKTNMFYTSVFLKTEDCKVGCPHMQVKIKGKVHPCAGTEALYSPQGE